MTAVLFITAFVVGPTLSSEPHSSYFASATPYNYVVKGILMNIHFDLPGVFQMNSQKSANGSLWTIPFEVYAYCLLAAAFLIGLFKKPYLCVIFLAATATEAVSDTKILFTWLPKNSEITLLAPCFTLGVVFAVFKNNISLSMSTFTGVWLLYLMFHSSSFNFYFFYLATFYSLIFISTQKWLLSFKPKHDISYGLYLWGWPVQQILAMYFSDQGLAFHQLTSIILASILGYCSWHIIEKRAITFGSKIAKKIGNHNKEQTPSTEIPQQP